MAFKTLFFHNIIKPVNYIHFRYKQLSGGQMNEEVPQVAFSHDNNTCFILNQHDNTVIQHNIALHSFLEDEAVCEGEEAVIARLIHDPDLAGLYEDTKDMFCLVQVVESGNYTQLQRTIPLQWMEKVCRAVGKDI